MKELKIIDDNTIEIDGSKYKKEDPKRVPLFLTEDGVEIFEKDIYYWVNKVKTPSGIEPFSIRKIMCCSNSSENFDKEYNVKNFSTKEAAEEYVLLNKPCLSYNDILNINGFYSPYMFKNNLQSLIKEKLT